MKMIPHKKGTTIYFKLSEELMKERLAEVWIVYDRPKGMRIKIARLLKQIGFNKFAERLSSRKPSKHLGVFPESCVIDYIEKNNVVVINNGFNDFTLIKYRN